MIMLCAAYLDILRESKNRKGEMKYYKSNQNQIKSKIKLIIFCCIV